MSITHWKNRVFMLNTEESSYVIYLDETGTLCNAYWGPHAGKVEDFADANWLRHYRNGPDAQYMREECSTFGNMRFKESSLKFTFADGTRDFRYKAQQCKIDGNLLTITLRDTHYPIEVSLFYRVYEKDNIIEKWRVVKNLGAQAITIGRISSAEYSLEGEGWQSLNFNGHWSGEFQLCSEPVGCGKKVYESLRGITGHVNTPAFVLHQGATEDNGSVYFGALAWSGNFKISVESVERQYLSVLAGISDTDFAWKLSEGESFSTPPVYSGHALGFTAMSHTLAKFAKNNVMPKRLANSPLPVIYNAWEAVEFDVYVDDQKPLADKAAKLGAELFVVDDGWFIGRKDDTAGLGDWFVDKEKFPNGLAELIDYVKSLNMRFGLWVEPEMINENSNLYRKHPQWALQYKNREIRTWRTQYMLDMANPEVLEYLYETLNRLLSEHDISYIKWDFNRYASEIASSCLSPEEFPSIWYRNVQNFYNLVSRLRSAHPNVEWEACAAGGGRVDYGAMQHFDEYWTSDNTDPLDRLRIQEGYSFLYPIKYMRAWITEGATLNKRSFPLRFYAHVAMCGALGIGRDLNKASEADCLEMAGYVAEYKRIRKTVQFGDIYRLASFSSGALQAVQYVNGKKSVLFAFLQASSFARPYQHIQLKGLQVNLRYRYNQNGTQNEKTGAYLMTHGLQLEIEGSFASVMIEFEICE